MKRIVILGLLALICSFTTFAQGTITTFHPYGIGACTGGTCALVDSVAGGVWSSSNVAVATVGTSGIVTAVSPGTCTISYTVALASATATFYVTAPPAPISGTGAICVGGSLTLTDATVGGSWTGSGGAASVNSITGNVLGLYSGTDFIYYVVGTGCYANTTVTVNATTFGSDSSIAGPSTVCLGTAITLSNGIGSGVWSSSTPGIATVGAGTGVVTGVSIGTTTISYTISGTCGSASLTKIITVTNTTSPGAITGTSVLYAGGTTITLADAVGGGTWSSSNTAVATIDPPTGVVTGVAAGTSTITYSVTGCSGPAYATTIVTVSAINGISGHVFFSGTPPYSGVKVWLITYNPSTFDLEAIDSMYATGSGTTYYYQFLGAPTDSFRIKASVQDSFVMVTTAYIPTYHDTSFYWHDATVLYHTSGTSDINQDINMLTGTPTTGPGFISGNVLTGANKGTSGSIPVVGLHMAVINTTTNTIAGMAFTDSTGNYSFSNLPYGTYTVFPDSVNYTTTPLTGIILNSGSSTFSAAAFTQHMVTKTITPGAEGVKNISSVSSVVAFPNPTNGRLNIMWNEKATENATVVISDITGRQVYTSTLTLSAGNGIFPVDVSTVNNGLYIITIKTATLSYDNKIEIRH